VKRLKKGVKHERTNNDFDRNLVYDTICFLGIYICSIHHIKIQEKPKTRSLKKQVGEDNGRS